MNNYNYIIVNNNKCFCPEMYRKSIAKNYMFSKRTVPCLITFTEERLSKTFSNKMCHYKFEDICLSDYDSDDKEFSPNNRFIMYNNVEFNGFLKRKNEFEEMKTSIINKEHSKTINDLIYTQSLFLFVIKSFKLYRKKNDDITLSIHGILLEPIVNIHDDDHLQIVKEYLESNF